MKETKKHQMLTDEDMSIIKNDASLSDYVVRTKVKETRKNMLIFGIVFGVVTFFAGWYYGISSTRESIPNNVVQITVDSDGSDSVNTDTTLEK